MADNNFRPFRSREPLAREDVDPTSDATRDPLAELARIIGRSNRVNQFDRDARYNPVETLGEPLPPSADRDWAANDGYAAPDAPDQYAEESYVQPRLPEPYPSDRAVARYEDDEERAPSIAAHYTAPAADHYDDERASDARYLGDDPHDARSYDEHYRGDDVPLPSVVRRAAALAPRTSDDEYETDEQWDDDRQSDYAEDYDDETPSKPRRSGVVVAFAMLALVLVGAGGAFAYRAMFGGAILAPSLPPVIKANEGPNKIVPNRSDAQAAAVNPAGAATMGSPEKLVSREEQPVAIQPPNAPPRVVSTIPVPPSAAPGAVPADPSIAPALPAAPALPSAPPKVAAPAQPPAAPLAGSAEPKKIHTVTIRSDQIGNAAAPAPESAPAAAAAPAPAVRPRATEAPARATAPKAGGGNAPLAIVPVAQGAAPPVEPPRSRVARTEAPSAPVVSAPVAAPSAGGYAVQVTSQRSEAEAQSAFKSLQAKFPNQLGNRQPIIHRADLGDKGTYYRAMVGPFASSAAAAAMCSNLKAAGGSCIVQKN